MRHRAGAITALVALLAALAPAGAGAAAQEPARPLTLVSQSPWVTPGTPATFALRVDPGVPADDLQIVFVAHQRVSSRSAFEATFAAEPRLGQVIDVYSTPAGPIGPDGIVGLTVPIQDRARGRDGERLVLPREGVYPVQVELRDVAGATLDGFTTYLVNTPTDPAPQKLGVVLVVPFHAAPGLGPRGARRMEEVDRLFGLARVLESHRLVQAVVVPTPESVESLAESSDTRAHETLGVLRQAVRKTVERPSELQTVPTTYVPVSFPELVQAGLGVEADQQVSQGLLTLRETLGPDVIPLPPGRPLTWLADDLVDDATVESLEENHVGQIVIPESALEPLRRQTTLARPFLLERTSQNFNAASGDQGLARHFVDDGDPVLMAHRLLADLAVLHFDQPSVPRGVVALPPRLWRPSPAFLDAVLSALGPEHPLLRAMTLDGFFSDIALAEDQRGVPLTRSLAPSAASTADAELGADITSLRSRMGALGRVLDPTHPLHQTLAKRLLIAQSSELLPDARRRYIRGVQDDLRAQREGIRVPDRPITLTSRKGQIPVTLRNRTGHPVCVRVLLDSDKLTFAAQPPPPPSPGDWCPRGAGGAGTSAWRQLRLDRPNTTLRFPVVAKTSGAFPVAAQLWGPPPPGEGGAVPTTRQALRIQTARFTVRSTAASWVGLVLSVGAGLFLALWWGRHIVRGRRARRLVPT